MQSIIFSILPVFAPCILAENLIVIMLDGVGNSLLKQTEYDSSSGFGLLTENGVTSEYVTPVFPSQGYPNWYSLVTGLYAENHGITADYMWDERSGMGFHRGASREDYDEIWWTQQPDPIWYTAGKSGMDVHCYWYANCHWPHIDMIVQVPIERQFNDSLPEQSEELPNYFPAIIERIKKYQSYKQQFFLIRYAGVANALRAYGSKSPEVKQAIHRTDQYLYDLQKRLDENGLFSETNLVVVSDHGTHPVDIEEQFYIEDCLSDYSRIQKLVNIHSFMMIFPQNDSIDDVFFELKVCDQWAPEGDLDDDLTPLVNVYRASELPGDLNWKNSRFMSPIVIMTQPGVVVLTRELPTIPNIDFSKDVRETGGWSNALDTMHGIFLSRGPAFKSNHLHPPIKMVDIYQLLTNVLAIEPAHPHNGTWTTIEDMLSDNWEGKSVGELANSARPLRSLLITRFLSFYVIIMSVMTSAGVLLSSL
ncbi:hypothetical protein AB6A40_006576 [Gnathostoma spinigerum]|uniref:Uncharacterized protein n=1 Tax=Gnathostoma spinigerum TaxID=75299 RepID=A0ABD6ETJ5_9BILA